MEIFFLGTGTAIPHREHAPAGLALRAADQTLLLDIGPGTLVRLLAAGIAYDQIDRLLLTHLHPDHTLDLATLMLAFNYAPGAERTAPFEITGGRDLAEFFSRLVRLYPEVAPVSFPLTFHQVYRDEFSFGNLRLRSGPTGHTVDSVGYRIDDGIHSVVYTGDANLQGELAKLAQGADLLITECSFPSGWKTNDHLNADTVAALAQEARVKELVIMHRYPPALGVDLADQICSRFDGKVHLAYDGMRMDL